MKTYQFILPAVALVATIIVLCYIIPYEDSYTFKVYEIEVEELERENRVLLEEIEFLDQKIQYLEKRKDSILKEKNQAIVNTFKTNNVWK